MDSNVVISGLSCNIRDWCLMRLFISTPHHHPFYQYSWGDDVQCNHCPNMCLSLACCFCHYLKAMSLWSQQYQVCCLLLWSMTESILLPSDETFITPSLTSDTDVVFTVFTLTFSGMLDLDFSVLILFSYLCRGLQIRSRNSFFNEHPAGFWMIGQDSISVVLQGSIFFGCEHGFVIFGSVVQFPIKFIMLCKIIYMTVFIWTFFLVGSKEILYCCCAYIEKLK